MGHANMSYARGHRNSSLTSGSGPVPEGLLDKDFPLFFKVFFGLNFILRSMAAQVDNMAEDETRKLASQHCPVVGFDCEFDSFLHIL